MFSAAVIPVCGVDSVDSAGVWRGEGRGVDRKPDGRDVLAGAGPVVDILICYRCGEQMVFITVPHQLAAGEDVTSTHSTQHTVHSDMFTQNRLHCSTLGQLDRRSR